MEHLALNGLWLVASLGVTYLIGVFTSQWARDKMSGVPSELRSVMRTVETDAKARLDAAKSAALSEVMNTIKPHVAAVVDPAPVAVAVAASGAVGAAGVSAPVPLAG